MCELNTEDSLRRRRERRTGERGIYLPLAVGGFFLVLTFVGLAVDTARLYRAKIELQQAVDAAAVASARLLVSSPGATLAADAGRAYQDSVAIITSNLLAAGYSAETVADMRDRQDGHLISACTGLNGACCYTPGQTFACSVTAGEERRYIEISARLRQPTLLLGFLPGIAQSTFISSRGTIENLKMQAILVLDSSWSMNEGWGGSGQTKGGSLKIAAKAFVDTLLPFDELAVVKFSAVGDGQAVSMDDYEPFNTTQNRTLLRAGYANDSQRIFPAPNNQANLLQIGAGATGVANKSQAKSAIDSLTFSGNTDIGSGVWRAKTLLDGASTGNTNILKLILLVTDGAPYGVENNYLPLTWWTVGERPRLPLPNPNCVGHPLWPALLRPTLCDGSNNVSLCQNNRRQRLRMLDAIIESDLARDAGYVVYSIGAGIEDNKLSSPFQNSENTATLKRFLLRRVANDQTAMRQLVPFPDPEDFLPPDPAYPWDFPCVPTGQELGAKPVGQYLVADNNQALLDAFLQVAAVRSRFQP